MLSRNPDVLAVLDEPGLEAEVSQVLGSYVTSHGDVENAFYGTRDKAFYVYPWPSGGLPPGFDPTARPGTRRLWRRMD